MFEQLWRYYIPSNITKFNIEYVCNIGDILFILIQQISILYARAIAETLYLCQYDKRNITSNH